jgi:CHAT domain-containing protein
VLHLGDYYCGLAGALNSLDRAPEVARYWRLAADSYFEAGEYRMACQLLGSLGVCYWGLGERDRAHAAWDEGLALARSQNSWQECRILSLKSALYRSSGQWSVTHELMRAATDRARELQADEMELRLLLDGMYQWNRLGCYDVVGRALPLADVLLRHGRMKWSDQGLGLECRVARLRAHRAIAIGDLAEARRVADEIERLSELLPEGIARQRTRIELGRILSRCGRPARARKLLQATGKRCRSIGLKSILDECALELAQACLDLDDRAGCRGALQEFRDVLRGSERITSGWTHHDVMAIQVALADSGVEAAQWHLETALARLERLRGQFGSGPEYYLWLAGTDKLRRLAHEIAVSTPADGYAVEMSWRRWPAQRMRAAEAVAAAATTNPAIERLLHGEPHDLLERLAERDAMHCVYDAREDLVVRWTAFAGQIVQDTLTGDIARMAERVRIVRQRLETSPGTNPEPSLTRDLNDLASWLLPEAARSPGGPQLLLVSLSGFLAKLPFEALSLSPTTNMPLLAERDVAYLRLRSSKATPRNNPVLVVSQPSYDEELRRRYSILTEDLPLGAAETNIVREVFPASEVLSGTAATKRNLVERWQQSSVLYFVSHIVRDPEIPYVVFLPLASGDSLSVEEARLEIVDIQAADLSRCSLVVLSGCATGEPYVSNGIMCPSLGETFLDAGADAVVATAWDVTDQSAARVMQHFLQDYRSGGTDPVSALCRARRRLLREGAGPGDWAAWSITLGAL